MWRTKLVALAASLLFGAVMLLRLQVAVTDDAAPTLGVDQVHMGRDMALDLRFNRLGQQLPRPSAQHIRQRIVGK